MADPKDMIVPMLKEMREEMRDGFAKVDGRFEKVTERLNKFDERQKSFNNALTADTMMSIFMLGDYEERLAKQEGQMADLLNKH